MFSRASPAKADPQRTLRLLLQPSALGARVNARAELQRSIGNQAVLRMLERHDRAVESAALRTYQPSGPCGCSKSAVEGVSLERAAEDSIPWFRSTTPASEVRSPLQGDDDVYDGSVQTPDQCACGQRDEDGDVREIVDTAPRGGARESGRPLEAGWVTGDWYKSKNTIMCDGAGSLTIHEATSYKYGVQGCTRDHEAQHMSDWYARYGKEVCKGRKKGDLPTFDPPGKDVYADFLKKSECAAWKIGKTCRDEALAACKDQACKDYVTPYTTQAAGKVKEFCGT